MWFLLSACRPALLTTPSPTSDAPTGPIVADPTGETGISSTPTCPACDDGLSCTEDTCDDIGNCFHVATTTCTWPAIDLQLLGYVDSSLLLGQSAAAWDRSTDRLWIAGGAFGDSNVIRIAENTSVWGVDVAGGLPAKWIDEDLDIEDLILDPAGDSDIVYVLSEGSTSGIAALDLSTGGLSTGGEMLLGPTWNLTPFLPPFAATLGPEGLAFVPDSALIAAGFVDPTGNERHSEGGMGGLMMVGHQNGGGIYVFDLSLDGGIDFVGQYDTDQLEVAGLSFDVDTGRLYIWHGGTNDLEIVKLSSSPGAGSRQFDTEYLFDYTGSANIEGITLMPTSECDDDGKRRMVLVVDDGQEAAVQLFHDWPLCAP